MYYAIIILIILLGLFLGVTTWMRRSIYKEIDQFDTWKMDVMNRPVTEEIARVKQLKMIGETEQKFEKWRQDWDDIVTVELPAIEERLFEAEGCADKYLYKKARSILQDTKVILESCEERISEMLRDLNQVVNSEEQNRKDIILIRDAYHQVKKQLITQRSQYQTAITPLESQLAHVEEGLKQFDQETDAGNYVKAREILLEVRNQLDQMEAVMSVLPRLYKEIQIDIPAQLKEMQEGQKEMEEQGYVLDHIQVDHHIPEMNKHLQLFVQALNKLDVQPAQEGIKDLHERIDHIYDQFEREVESRKMVTQENPTLKHDIFLVSKEIEAINNETEIVQESYRMESEDLSTQRDLSSAFDKLEKEYLEVEEVIKDQKQAYSILLEKMEDMRNHLKALRDAADTFKEKLQALRKDEFLAKETLQSLRKKLIESKRLVQKSNLPGVPDSFMTVMEDAEEVLSEVMIKLDVKPLDMQSVNQVLKEALDKVDFCGHKAKEIVDAAILSEKLIQYGNRYRSQMPLVDRELRKAEAYFRSYNYEEALEIVAFAINQVDPGALKKFEVSLQEIS